ncbi:MAG: hypothetical protein ABJF23_21640 [Bryobacteraceae bacterium]
MPEAKKAEALISRSIWNDMVKIAKSERPHTRETWQAHCILFEQWLNAPLRKQAEQLRYYWASYPHMERPDYIEDWEFLIPAGQAQMSGHLFLTDLACFLRVVVLQQHSAFSDSAPLAEMPEWNYYRDSSSRRVAFPY